MSDHQPEDPHYHGHRQRLRERFLRAGFEGLPAEEIEREAGQRYEDGGQGLHRTWSLGGMA
jgi:hypothetical protein